MKRRDYLWCALNLLLDHEEELGRLCPSCRAQAEEGRCPVCGGAAAAGSIGTGPGRIAVVERQTEESAAGVTAAELDRVLERDARRYDAGFRLF